MRPTLKLLAYVRPYARRAVLALVLLSTLVVLDLAIPRLIQRIIDQGITAGNRQVVIQTALLMIAISFGVLVSLRDRWFGAADRVARS